MIVVGLPVSGVRVCLRQPAGAEDLMLAEADCPSPELALALLERLTQAADGSHLEVSALSLTDLDVLLVRLRAWLLGDWVRADADCPDPACAAPADLSLRLSEYLRYHEPRVPRGVERSERAGWYRATSLNLEFRVPTVLDVLLLKRSKISAHELLLRCLAAEAVPLAARGRLERLMQALAPNLYNQLTAHCPECGKPFSIYFDPQRFVLQELMARALSCYEEIHLLASTYHWSEAQILELPHTRRARYASLAAEGRAQS